MLANAGTTTALAKCVTGQNFAAMETFSYGVERLNGDFGLRSAKYPTFENCMADRTRALEEARYNSRSVLGGLCRISDSSDTNGDHFVFEVFYRGI
jgi:hypothetical protein